jgi:putative ABC transport system substrate-binding protein
MIQSLARPGGNVTGTTAGIETWMSKPVELLKTTLPRLERLAILTDTSTPNDGDLRPHTKKAAQTLGLQVLDLDAHSAQDVDSAFDAAIAWGADGLYQLPIATFVPEWARISAHAAGSHLPVMYGDPLPITEHRGLMAFGPDHTALWRQSADYVDKILRGARPTDLPVQEPRQWDFIVNVKTAEDLGITFPPDVAAQVTQWIQ